MTRDISNVLFLCTGNSARSMMAEANLDLVGMGKFKANSAGSKSGPTPRPITFDLLKDLNHNAGLALFKSWDAVAGRAPAATRSSSACPSDRSTGWRFNPTSINAPAPERRQNRPTINL